MYKYYAISPDGKKIGFGAQGYSDYTIHKDDARKERFLSRFSRLRTDDPYKAMFWAEGILWNKKSVDASFRDLKRRYDLKGWKLVKIV